MFLSYEQVAISNSVKTVSDLTVPAKATFANLQADTQNIRYTLDGSTAPTTSSGMVLLTSSEPTTFLIEEIRNIKFIRSGGSDANLNVHYGGGRDI